MEIREYRPSDCKEMADLFYQTIHTVNAKDYSKEQLNVWATGTVNLNQWNLSFLEHDSVVAVENDMVIGFGDIDRGYIDRLYVHKDYQKMGVATAIVDTLEEYAIKHNVAEITTHASITAKPFFQKRGFHVVKEQQVERSGVYLTNYIMVKKIR